ncbi:MAG: hypothetical protein K2P84_07630 [Undibacterium sp.]|nr:hypothetical protein [Undibacterium sp.]
MNRLLLVLPRFFLGFFLSSVLSSFLCVSAFAAAFTTVNCTNLTNAIELETLCKPGATSACILVSGQTYKISASSSSLNNSYPPIQIPSSTALCISNSTVSGTPLTLYAQSIGVNGGTFQIGSAQSPIASINPVTIVMTGNSSNSHAPQPVCKEQGSGITCSSIANKTAAASNGRDITVMNGGHLFVYGAKGLTKNANGSFLHDLLGGQSFSACYTMQGQPTPGNCSTDFGTPTNNLELDPYFNKSIGSNSWAYLAMPAGANYYNANGQVQAPVDYSKLKVYVDSGLTTPATLQGTETTLVLSKDVTSDSTTGWQVGDWVSVSTTGFSSHQSEIVQICGVLYAPNPETNTTVYPELSNDPFYKGTTTGAASYKAALGLGKAVSVLVLAGRGCNVGIYQDPGAVGTPLKHYHFGSLMTTPGFFPAGSTGYTNSSGTQYQNIQNGQAYSMYDGSLRNFGIDERAEVALLTRNVKFTSSAGQGSTPPQSPVAQQYYGGHLAVMNMEVGAANEQVELLGLEIEKFGQALVGRYPLHFHRLNADSNTEDAHLRVQDVSVHHSYNKCFVPHATKGIKFYNNVCVRAIGQGFYLEDGYRIEDNQFVRNLVVGVMGASLAYTPYSSAQQTPLPAPGTGNNQFWSGDYLVNDSNFISGNYDPSQIADTSDSGANTGYPIDALNPNGFWITSLGGQLTPNMFINNSVAGCQMQGRAYWILTQTLPNAYTGAFPKQTSYPVFNGNRGHGCYAGVDTDARMLLGSANATTSAPYPVPPAVGVGAQANAPIVIFNDMTLTRQRYKAFWTRSLFSSLLNSRFSANKQGATILGGGGPEGNLLGFWGLVKDNVFASVTNNNVDRYYDCEKHMANQSSSMQALGVNSYNEASECVAFATTPVVGHDQTLLVNVGIANDTIVLAGEGSAINGSLQGYTYYDGPARMEYTRFINFRADPTDYINRDNGLTRYLTTRVDSRKMLDKNYSIDQFGIVLNPIPPQTKGGAHHYGYEGDPAMAWIKGNSQSLPPTQYTLGNIWENTDYKHQVFTETVNMANGISDGDKQTIILDKDASLAGFQVCNQSGCNDAINHYPISLNNLSFYATPYTIDEPHAIGRNNVIETAIMSPHKYATINIETSPNESVGAAPANGNGVTGNGAFNLQINRDMPAYDNKSSSIILYGRGGQPIFETFLMNNMGYSIYPQNNATPSKFNGNLLLSYSDAPTDSLFIDRIGLCMGTDLKESEITVGRLLRQWGSSTNYLSASPYWTDMQNVNNCQTLFNGQGSWSSCNSNATALTPLPKTGSLKDINLEFVALSKLLPGDSVSQSYFYDKTSGMLYFNMLQLGDNESQLTAITPPYSTCDASTYQSAFPNYSSYEMFSNSGSITASLQTACFFPKNQAKVQAPQNSRMINCPRAGCSAYTVGVTGKHKGNGICTPSAQALIVPPASVNTAITQTKVDALTHQLVYGSPYWLTTQNGLTVVSPTLGKVAVSNYPGSGQTAKNFHFYCDQAISPNKGGKGLLPLFGLACATTNTINLLGNGPGTPTVNTQWNLVAGAGMTATISGADFVGPPPTYTPASSYTVSQSSSLPGGLFYLLNSYPQTVTLTISGTYSGSCSTIILNADGSVNDEKCSSQFRKHLVFVKGGGNAGAPPSTIIVNP